MFAACLIGCLVGETLIMASRPATAHHSYSMFEYGSPIEIEGTVQEFRYVNPHTFIVIKVREKDGRLATWTLEGQPPAMLERDGWSRGTLKPGDQIKLTVAPLRSGAAGGSWTPQLLHFRDGRAVAIGR